MPDASNPVFPCRYLVCEICVTCVSLDIRHSYRRALCVHVCARKDLILQNSSGYITRRNEREPLVVAFHPLSASLSPLIFSVFVPLGNDDATPTFQLRLSCHPRTPPTLVVVVIIVVVAIAVVVVVIPRYARRPALK